MRKTTAARNADALAERQERVKALKEKLENGVKAIFESEDYARYLEAMSKFHHYSFGNCLLIFFQCPEASAVAGYTTWKRLGRTVKKGEKGIQILAPCPFKAMIEQNKLDDRGRIVFGPDGKPETESTLVNLTRFKIAYVFDVSQTEGKELPSLGVDELTGDVEGFDEIFSAVEAFSPVPIHFREPEDSKGCYNQLEQCIYVNKGMSQVQTMKTLIHETAHAKLHALPVSAGIIVGTPVKDRRTREVEAESIAYVVCQHFGIDTSDYSFAYVTGWSKNKETPELKSSLDCISKTAAEMIDAIEKACPAISRTTIKEQEAENAFHRETHFSAAR
jgi:antirestriction protein ArdC